MHATAVVVEPERLHVHVQGADGAMLSCSGVRLQTPLAAWPRHCTMVFVQVCMQPFVDVEGVCALSPGEQATASCTHLLHASCAAVL
jgi:hypothetical protein